MKWTYPAHGEIIDDRNRSASTVELECSSEPEEGDSNEQNCLHLRGLSRDTELSAD